MKSKRSLWLLSSFVLYVFTIGIATLFSYSFVDPNLVISSNALYWQWQQWLWLTWFDHPLFQAQTYALVISMQWIAFASFAWQVKKNWHRQQVASMLLIMFAVVLGVAFLSYNWLSHDVFNYLFNARMVVAYQANPHLNTALDFPWDPWLRFMHNTHTSAPYGYGWTGISLLPYILGGGKFLSSWLLFRLMAVLSLLSTGVVIWRWLAWSGLKDRQWLLFLLLCSPFVLSEVIMNAHNDLWMVLPAVSSIFILDGWRKQGGVFQLATALALIGFSISIKFATVVLVPLMILMVASRWVPNLKKIQTINVTQVSLIASLLMFIPLFDGRSQYFHPWYLLWSLMWLPLLKSKWWQALLAGFAISSMYRYLPWIAAGGFQGDVLLHQQLVTWIGGVLLGGIFLLLLQMRERSV